ncbi:MAG: homoserine kinase [Actinobacteria bacterium]|nr:homoserine kinase [Actinomycetota bacterium]
MSRATTTPLRVRVPASSANLGPGFDILAVALDLFLQVRAEPFDGRRVVCAGEGATDLPGDDGNLIWRAVRVFCDTHGVEVPDVTLHCDNQIPLERGLGSSAAAAVAGVTLARRLTGVTATDQQLIELAALLEGHADNAAAAVLGGLVVAGRDGRAHRFDPTRSLRPVVCIPEQRAATSATRALVPRSVTVPTMIDTARGTALVLTGLAGLTAWDPALMADDVVEPPRLEVMSGSRRLIAAARDAGHGACLSGAGPSVLAVVAGDDADAVGWLTEVAGDGWQVVPARWDRAGARVDAHVGTVR